MTFGERIKQLLYSALLVIAAGIVWFIITKIAGTQNVFYNLLAGTAVNVALVFLLSIIGCKGGFFGRVMFVLTYIIGILVVIVCFMQGSEGAFGLPANEPHLMLAYSSASALTMIYPLLLLLFVLSNVYGIPDSEYRAYFGVGAGVVAEIIGFIIVKIFEDNPCTAYIICTVLGVLCLVGILAVWIFVQMPFSDEDEYFSGGGSYSSSSYSSGSSGSSNYSSNDGDSRSKDSSGIVNNALERKLKDIAYGNSGTMLCYGTSCTVNVSVSVMWGTIEFKISAYGTRKMFESCTSQSQANYIKGDFESGIRKLSETLKSGARDAVEEVREKYTDYDRSYNIVVRGPSINS